MVSAGAFGEAANVFEVLLSIEASAARGVRDR
jgi:hypothetical protein